MWYVYLLQSQKTGNYYIGQTDKLEARVKKHNRGEVVSTRAGRPWKLIGYELFNDQSSARWREYQLKHHSGRRKQFIQAFVKNKKRKRVKSKPARRGG